MTQAIPIPLSGHYRFKQVIRSETVKILTLPSTAITFAITVVTAGLVTGLVAKAALHHNTNWYIGFDPTQSALTGLIVAGLTGGVFGALCITGEYGSGTIRTTLAATPRRLLLLAAKMAVTAGCVLAFSELLSFGCFWMGEAILSGGGAPSAGLGSPGALRAVIMTGAFVALLGMMSFGLGLIFRSTAGAIAGFVGVTFVLQLVLRGISERDVRYAPVNILINSIMSTVGLRGPRGPLSPVSPGVGLTLMAVYTLAALAVGAGVVRETRRLSNSGAGEGWMQIRIPDERAELGRRLARRVVTEPFRKRPWAELGFFLASGALAGASALAVMAGFFAGLGLTVVIIGVVILAATLRLARDMGGWYRGLALLLLGERIPPPDAFKPRPGLLGWLRAALGDRAAWRTIGYLVAKVPLAIFGVWFALSIWVQAIVSLLIPLIGGRGPGEFGILGRLSGPGYQGSGSLGHLHALAMFATGAILVFVAPWAMRLVVSMDRGLMHLLLGPDAATSRVRRLEESRAQTVDASAATLRRIERDLHDGTQAQLVALAMRLGQAKDKLDHLGAIDHLGPVALDLDAVRRLVDEAHRGAKEAITDLRDLARGIHPPALDTGLENALVTLAARSSVPTQVTVAVQSRPTPAIEAISYFCAAELLANVAQHARASRASLSCAQHGPWLRIVVRDDGQGGAGIDRVGSSSSGLVGLADRIKAVDGHLSIASPPGGPTVVTVDLPFHP